MNREKIIYVVDDDKIHHFMMKKLLKIVGYNSKIYYFTDGELALLSLKNAIEGQEALPDIIFLDINMPIMDGFEFLESYENIKESIEKKILIHVVSSSVDQIDIEKIRINGNVVSFITKPVSTANLNLIIERE